MVKRKRTKGSKNDLQNTTQKLKIEQHETFVKLTCLIWAPVYSKQNCWCSIFWPVSQYYKRFLFCYLVEWAFY